MILDQMESGVVAGWGPRYFLARARAQTYKSMMTSSLDWTAGRPCPDTLKLLLSVLYFLASYRLLRKKKNCGGWYYMVVLVSRNLAGVFPFE